MLSVNEITWSPAEQEIAQIAFDKAYTQEIETLLLQVRNQAGAITSLQELWTLHDFLSARRHDIDGKYDFQYPDLVFTFARLVKEGWLCLEDLQGLGPDKLTKIAVLSRM